MAIISYKFAAYPSADQQKLLKRQFVLCNWLQKFLVDYCFQRLRTGGSIPTHFVLCNMLPEIKEKNCELKEVNAQVLQNVARRVAIAMRGVMTREIDEKDMRKSLPSKALVFPQFGKGCRWKGNDMYLDKIGAFHVHQHTEIVGTVKTATITLSDTGKWYVVLASEVKEPDTKKTSRAVGIDFGIKNFITLSNGQTFAFPLSKERREIAREVRKQRKQPKVTAKDKRRLANMRENYKNRTVDFLNKLVNQLTKEYDSFYVEDIQKQGLMRQGGIMRAIISAMPWRRFIQQLRTKCRTKGLVFELVSPVNTSRMCSGCGNIRTDLTLKDRVYNCTMCGVSICRDKNAAINILCLGAAGSGLGS